MSLSLGLGAGGASAALNAYWGQTGGYRLRDICDSGVNYATVSFINNSPEHGKGGYPGSNFGANCAAEAYPHHKTKQPTELLSNCYLIKEDIPYCQSKGVKVLLAIGGQASLTSQYAVSSVDKGIEFAEFLYKAYGPYDSSWEGPRPFDNSETEHVSIDGFDLDLEDKTSDFSNEPYIAMVDWWREQKQAMFITAAPECVITSKWLKNQNDDLIHNAKFDALFIQFYNNPVCDALNGGFSYDAWAEQIASGKSKDAKLFIGLPALATSSGYYPQEKLKELVCEYSRHKNFGGVSLWDGTQAMNNHVTKGQSYLQSAMDAVKYLCHEPPKSTASNSTSTTPTASVSSKMLATSKASAEPLASSIMSEKLGTIKATASNSTSTTPTASVSSKMLATSKASAEPPASSGKSEKPGTIKATASASTSTSFASSSLRWSNSTITKATQTTVKPVSLTTSEPASVSTSTVYSVSVYTVTKCPLTVTGCSTGQVTTETFFSTASPAVETAQPPKPTPSKAPVLTTKTVYTTTTYIVTACPNAVPGCNVGDATTEVIRYTTVCPVGETETAEPAPTKAPVLTTKTVYTTTTYIVTACPNAVPGCNVGDATTEVIRYTTVCPVGETETAKVPQPTGPAPEVPDIDTKPPIKTVKLHSTSALEPSVRSKAVTSRPTGATETPKPGCAGADCSGIALPTNSWTKEPGSGCVGPKCSGVAIPSNGVAGSRSRPSSVPSPIMTAGASTVALSLAGLVAVVAAQILAI